MASDRERNIINEYKQKIRVAENRINEKGREIEESEKKLTANEKALSEERANTPNLKAAFDEAKRELNERAEEVKQFKSIDAIEQIIDSYIKHIEEKSDLEKEQRIAERQKAERAAEEKRRKLIAKQRERNTEKRFDEISASQTETSEEMLTWQPAHEEKKHENADAGVRAYPAVADAILDQTHAFGEQLKMV